MRHKNCIVFNRNKLIYGCGLYKNGINNNIHQILKNSKPELVTVNNPNFTSVNSDKKESDSVKLGSFTSGSKLAPNGVDNITQALKAIKFKKEKKQNIKLEI